MDQSAPFYLNKGGATPFEQTTKTNLFVKYFMTVISIEFGKSKYLLLSSVYSCYI